MKKKIIGISIMMLMIFSVLASAQVNLNTEINALNMDSGSIQSTISVGEYHIQETNQGSIISIDNYGHLLIPGKPNLPSKIISIAIPPGSHFVGYNYDILISESLGDNYYVQPTPLARAIGTENPNILKQDQMEYQLSEISPYTSDKMWLDICSSPVALRLQPLLEYQN